jgi:hypothetical protein
MHEGERGAEGEGVPRGEVVSLTAHGASPHSLLEAAKRRDVSAA